MKLICFFSFILFIPGLCFSQEVEWIKTEGEIIEITFHQGKRVRESAIVKFKLKGGTEQFGNVELTRIPFIGSMKSVGDVIMINYDPNNPIIVQTNLGKLIADYGMYLLIILGVLFSIKPFLNSKKKLKEE